MRYLRTHSLLLLLALSSCTTMRYTGVNRVRDYHITSSELPTAFDGYRIAFASDFHLESKFKKRQLQGTIKALKALSPNLLLLGGDYQEGCKYVVPLFAALSKITTSDGTFAVLGNNDYERCTALIRSTMREKGIILLEDSTVTIHRDSDSITLWGANAYAGRYPTAPIKTVTVTGDEYQGFNEERAPRFIILLTHTPDLVEDTDIRGVDLALAGHTHGGQVTLFGLYAPITASKYGTRFRTGLRHNTQGIPVIISGGLGTSQHNIRFCAPTDITIVTLKRK